MLPKPNTTLYKNFIGSEFTELIDKNLDVISEYLNHPSKNTSKAIAGSAAWIEYYAVNYEITVE